MDIEDESVANETVDASANVIHKDLVGVLDGDATYIIQNTKTVNMSTEIDQEDGDIKYGEEINYAPGIYLRYKGRPLRGISHTSAGMMKDRPVHILLMIIPLWHGKCTRRM